MTEPVDIEFRINDQELAQASRRAVDSIMGINSAGEQTVKALKNQIGEQKQLIKSIEQDVKDITKAYEGMAPGRAKDKSGSELRYVKRILSEVKDELKELEIQLDAASEASKRLTSTKRSLNDQMSRLKLAGQQDTAEFRQLAEQAGVVEKAIQEVNKQTTLLGKTDSNFQGLVNEVSGLTGALSAGAGAMALFGTESKDLQQVQTRLQALMALTIGLQSAYNAVNKESAFQTVIVTKAKKLWTAAQIALNTQLGILTAMSKALMVSGIGLLIAGVYTAIKVFQEWNKEQKEHSRVQSEAQKNIQTEITNLKSLEAVLKDSKNTYSARKAALDKLKESMPGYNAMLDKEGRLIEDNTGALEKYIEQLKNAAVAKIYADRVANAQLEYNDWYEGLGETYQGYIDIGEYGRDYGKHSEVVSRLLDKREELIDKIEKQEAQLNKYNAKSLDNKLPSFGTKEYWENEQKTALTALSLMNEVDKGTDNWNKTIAKLNQANEKLKTWDFSGKQDKTVIDANKLKSETADRLAAIQEAQNKVKQQEYQNEINLQQQQIGLMQDGAQKVRAQIQLDYEKRLTEIALQGDEMVKEQQKIERQMREAQNPDWKKKGMIFTPTTTSIGQLPENQQRYLEDQLFLAGEEQKKSTDELNKQLLEKYKDYASQRLVIEEKFDKDLKDLRDQRAIAEEQGNAKMIESLDRAIAEATKKKGKELISFDFNIFKESPEYVRAFEDLKATSTDTLQSLLSQLEAMKGQASEVLNPTELREYINTIQEIVNELIERNPFGALADAQNKVSQSAKKLAEAKKKLDEAQKSGDPQKIANAQREYNEALDETTKASRDAQKAQKKVTDVVEELYDAIDAVGNAIGGTTGEIITFIADIGKFVSVTAQGMTTTSETASRAVQMIERASAILFIIQMAIKLIGQLQSFLKSSHQQYLDFSKEVAQINALRQAVTDYEIAVTKARQAQENWFADDGLRNLKNEWELNGKYAQAYFDKVNETQAKYVNEAGGGWWNNWGKAIIETTTRFAHGDTLGGIESIIRNQDKYDKDTVRAIDNLRIETRAKTSGFLGIGGQSQKTEDLRTWAERNGFGQIFDENDIIDISVAEEILKANEEGTITLVGETEKTLETLVEYQKLYEEYQQQLQEYVSSLYSPLVDSFVDSIWAWFDEGKDALDSFKEYASDTFRDIVSDLIKTIALKNVFGTFSDDITDLYDQYAQGKISEEELMAAVAKRTDQLVNNAEGQLPVIQDLVNTLSAGLSDVGIDIKKPTDDTSSQQAERGMFQTMSQQTGDELLGQFTAIRIHTSNISAMIAAMENEDRLLSNHLEAIEINTHDTVDELKVINTRLKRIETEGLKLQ